MTNEELAVRIKAGEPALMADLWENCHKLLILLMDRELAKGKRERMERHGVTEEDLRQELFFALKKAVEGFNPDAGIKFTSYLTFPVRSVIDAALGLRYGGARSSDPINRYPTSLDAQIVRSAFDDGQDGTLGDLLQDPNSESFFEVIEEADYQTKLHADLEAALSELPERQERTIRSRYYEDKTLEEVAEDQSLSHERVRQNEYSALMQLREAQALQSYRADIIEKYSYHSGLRSFRSNNFTSGVEIAAMRLVMEEERMKKRAARAARRDIELLQEAEKAPAAGDVPAERKRRKWR